MARPMDMGKNLSVFLNGANLTNNLDLSPPAGKGKATKVVSYF
jgi:hypothetical protein